MSKASYTPLDPNPREDFIDNSEAVDVLPRLCRLSRIDRKAAYGFGYKAFKNDGLYVVSEVFRDLPASISGLREGDFILEINGESIDGMEHSQVVQLFNTRPTSVDLLVRNDFNANINLKNKIDEFNSEKATLKACRLS